MRKMSRILAAILLLVLVGCSSSKQGGDPPTKIPDKPVELVILTSFTIQREALDDVIDLYKAKHPNVKIRVKEERFGGITNSDGSVNQSVLEGVDIILQSSGFAKYLYSKEVVRDLSTMRLPTFDPQVAGLADEISKFNGTRIGVPVQITTGGLTLNTATFTKANLPLPPVDWTIQEFEQTLMQFKNAGVKTDLDLSFVFQPVLAAYGGKVRDTASREVLIDRPEAVEALTWLGQAVQNGLLSYARSDEPRITMRMGPDAPPIGGSFGGLQNLPPGLILQALPRGPAGRSTQVDGSLGLVLQSSPNPEVAIDFLREMIANPEAQRVMARVGIRPLLNDTEALALWQEKVGDRNVETINLGLMSGTTEGSAWMMVNDDLQGFFTGKASLEQLLPAIKQKLQP